MRGTGSLQQLLGRTYNNKKRGTTAAKPQQPEVQKTDSATAAPPSSGSGGCGGSEAPAPRAADKCLSKSNGGRSLQQSTLLAFARRPVAASWASPACAQGRSSPAPGSSLVDGSAAVTTAPGSGAATEAEPGPSQRTCRSPARTAPRRTEPLAVASQQGQLHCFECCIVGRQFQEDSDCRPGQRVALEAEPSNLRDPNAVLARDAHSGRPLGHLPRSVARHLGPLLRRGAARAEAVVLEVPAGLRAPVPVDLQVSLAPGSGGGGKSPSRAAAALRACREEAARAAARPAAGERLRGAFLSLVREVTQHDWHLLDEAELAWADAFEALPPAAQCLFIRLYLRRGPWFRATVLSYSDVPSVRDAVAALTAAGMAELAEPGALAAAADASSGAAASLAAQPPEVEEVAAVLTLPELCAAMRMARGLAGDNAPATMSQPQALAALQRQAALGRVVRDRLLAALLDATGPLVRLEPRACEAVARMQRLFFLNEGQTLSQFIAADAGGLQYPQFQVQRSWPAFPSREALLAYERALGHAAQLADALEAEDFLAGEQVLQHTWAALDGNLHKRQAGSSGQGSGKADADAGAVPLFLQRFDAGWVYCMMATAGVSLLERQRRYPEAVERLQQLLGGSCCPSRRGSWWLRLSTNVEHLGRPTEALELAEAGLADDWVTGGDRLGLQRRVLRLGKPPRRWRRPPWAAEALAEPRERRIEARPLAGGATGLKSRFYGLDGEQCGVEELALQYYASEAGGAWQGVHSEGGVWATLWALLLWDPLFSPVPDVFRSRLQTAPLDLDTDAFFPARQELIEARLAEVAAGAAPDLLAHAWAAHQGTMCRGVSWDRWSLDQLTTVAQCVGGPGLAAVCRLLSQDHAGWTGGMPDLLLWRAPPGGPPTALLAEVKGPRDRLSDQQRAWIAALARAGLDVEVLKVVEPSSRTKRGRGG